jgi:hypothetical protein
MNNFFRRFYVRALAVVVLTIGGATCFAQVDTDGDGFTDQEELYLGTNPNDASSYPGCITNGFSNATNLIYVAKNGSDSNPGTVSQPFLTIQKAITVAQGNSGLNIGSTIIVQPGAYRESVTLMPSGGVLHAPVVLQAATNGTATISGGDVWTNGWSLASGSTTIYQHSWTNNWGLSGVPSGWPTLSNITRRTEIVIVNGNLYTQVESVGAMTNGTYFVDETNRLLNVEHLAGVVQSNAFYEVSQRRSLLEVNNYNTGAVMSNLVVRGMDFRCAASLVESGAVRMINCKNVLYENCSFELNNWTGLYIGATSNVTLRGMAADNNGTKGFEQYQVSGTVYDGVQTCFNNWRGALGQFYGWALAGSKLLHIHRALFRDYISYSNTERGMWFDSDCATMLFERCTLNANLISLGGFGLFIEANEGPIRLQDCVIARNGGDWGLLGNCTENVTVSNCVVYANGTGTGGELGSSVNTPPRVTTDFETGVIHTNQLRFWNITDSVFSGLATTQLEVHLVNNLTNFLTTLTSDGNFWYNSATSNMFKVVSTSYDLSGWRTLTGQDKHSAFLSLLVTNPAVQDTYINLGATTNNYGSATNAVCDTQSNGTGKLDVVLLRFDLSSLTNTPREAELQLAVTSILNNRSVVFNVYRLTTEWDENATAGQAKSVSGWAAGTFSAADYNPQPYGIGGTRSGPGLNTIVDITALVQEWVSGTSSNYGVAIIARPVWDRPVNDPSFPNWKQFNIATRESSTQSQRPQITSISRGSSASPPPPSASFTGSPTNGTEPLSVTFTDTSTGTIASRSWDFGDTTTTNVTTNVVAHTYAAGTYGVTLVVTGPGGVSTNSQLNYITALTAFQAWQIQYFGSTTNPAAAASADPDGDGQNNLAEFLSGTNPTNSASSLHIISVATQSSDVLVTWATAGGETNVVQATAGLPDGSCSTNFFDLSPLIIIAGTGDAITNYLDGGGATNVPARYYRVRLVP